MIPTHYRPRHNPGCACVVCWTNAFHLEMTQRNEARAERCRELITNAQVALPQQSSMFTVFDEVIQ